MKQIVFTFLVSVFAGSLYSAQPTCHPHPGENYCQYTGVVKSAYINDRNLVLVYFDTPMDVARANELGIGISSGVAAAVSLNDNAEFAKLFYSTSMTSVVSGKEVTIQMRGSKAGYPRADRIWINQ